MLTLLLLCMLSGFYKLVHFCMHRCCSVLEALDGLKKLQASKLEGIAYLQEAFPSLVLPSNLKELSVSCGLCTKAALDWLLAIPQASSISVTIWVHGEQGRRFSLCLDFLVILIDCSPQTTQAESVKALQKSKHVLKRLRAAKMSLQSIHIESQKCLYL